MDCIRTTYIYTSKKYLYLRLQIKDCSSKQDINLH